MGELPELVDPFEGDPELYLALAPADERLHRAIADVKSAQPRWFA